MKSYNLDKLIKVRVSDFKDSIWYSFKTEIKSVYFWQYKRKEGFYLHMAGCHYKGINLPTGHLLKQGSVLELPQVKMYFQEGFETVKYFDTLIKAQVFADKLTKGNNWLIN